MTGTLLLAWRHAVRHRGRTLVLVACIALTLALPAAAQRVVDRFRAQLTARADATPILVGPRASRFDVLFAGLHFRAGDLRPLPNRLHESLLEEPGILSIPIHLGFTARGRPIVGTGSEYAELRGHEIRAGAPAALLGDAVLGSAAASSLGLGPGDEIASDQRELYDIAVPPSIRLAVTGVLAPTGTADDDAIFVDVRTCWLLAGRIHGHDDAAALAERGSAVIGAEGDHVAVRAELVERNAVGEEAALFHAHGDLAEAPLTVLILVPETEKVGTIVRARLDASPEHQAFVPSRVVEDLLAAVFRVKRLVDALALLLGVSTAALVALIFALTIRMRAAELETLHRIGCPRWTTVRLVGMELLVIVAGAVLLAAPLVLAVDRLTGAVLLRAAV